MQCNSGADAPCRAAVDTTGAKGAVACLLVVCLSMRWWRPSDTSTFCKGGERRRAVRAERRAKTSRSADRDARERCRLNSVSLLLGRRRRSLQSPLHRRNLGILGSSRLTPQRPWRRPRGCPTRFKASHRRQQEGGESDMTTEGGGRWWQRRMYEYVCMCVWHVMLKMSIQLEGAARSLWSNPIWAVTCQVPQIRHPCARKGLFFYSTL